MNETKQGLLNKQVSRRWMLKSSAGAAAAAATILPMTLSAELPKIAVETTEHNLIGADLHTGEIFDRERHHRWDTV